jgi:hypothetical protein
LSPPPNDKEYPLKYIENFSQPMPTVLLTVALAFIPPTTTGPKL